MKADQLNKARNPLLPAAMVAIQRAAERARNEAVRTHTGVIIARAGMIERIVLNTASFSASLFMSLNSGVSALRLSFERLNLL
ncbi:MAG: hypothetical protein ABW100_18720 [Candidatus Thiodiazotropha sp. 6PLUC3]